MRQETVNYYGAFVEIIDQGHKVITIGDRVILVAITPSFLDPVDKAMTHNGLDQVVYDAFKADEEPPHSVEEFEDDNCYIGTDGVVVYEGKLP